MQQMFETQLHSQNIGLLYNEICLQITQLEAHVQVINNSTHPYTVSVFAICPMASPICP